ncbi:MAG: hypothetical protein JW869_06415 [Candidatus Omnitrophica bacterium]|nr:hypothetical protein [Candidatus Omnitrophota bacterium]
MTVKNIIEKCNSLDISEQRSVSEDYCELVFFNKELEEWNNILTEILGPAKKPPGMDPTQEDDALTEEYGGIFTNQTLFKKDFDDCTIIAMIWPWQDGTHTTLKLAYLKK